MSTNSGIEFSLPQIAQHNGLLDVPLSGHIANALSHRNIPSYPPLRLEQILKLLENGSAEAITVLEWFSLFRQEIFFENDEEGQRAVLLIWQAISMDERLSRLTFYLIGLYLNEQLENFPRLLIQSMSVVSQFLTGFHKQRVTWLLAVQQRHFSACIQIAKELNEAPTEVAMKLNLPAPTLFRASLIKSLFNLILDDFTDANQNYIFDCIDSLTKHELIKLVDTLLVKSDSEIRAFLDWIELRCHPNSDDTLWFKLNEKSRHKLNRTFKLSNFFILQKIVDAMTTDSFSGHGFLEQESPKIKSRTNFWSNYSEKIGQMRFLIPSSFSLDEELFLSSSNIDYIVIDDKHKDGNNFACIFELENVIVVLVLTGNASELRLFDTSQRNLNRLLKDTALTITDIRKMACLHVHDHVTLWQYFCERILRKQLGILPNNGIRYFIGMRKEFSKYNKSVGLPKPTKEQIQKRARYLGGWFKAFDTRERLINHNSALSVNRNLQFAKMAMAEGNSRKYMILLQDACSSGNLEAKYIYSLDILKNTRSTKEDKQKAEKMLIQSAVDGYAPSQKLCKKFNLSLASFQELNSSDIKSLSASGSKKKSIRNRYNEESNFERYALREAVKSKINEDGERKFVDLYLNELREIANLKNLTDSHRKMLIDELMKRTRNKGAKALIAKLHI